MLHVPHHTARISIPVDPRHVVGVEGHTLVLRNGARVRTGYSEPDLRKLLEWHDRRVV